MKKQVVSYLFLLICSFTVKAQKNSLIEFGWDYPDVSQLSTNLPSMQNTPFDGICFSLQRKIMEAFDADQKPSTYFQLMNLKDLQWGKYKSNLIMLRGFSKTGGNWYNDTAWLSIVSNMQNLSRAMANPNIDGILFDPEYYYDDPNYNPWTFSEKQYPGKTFKEVQQQVQKRGGEFVSALQKYKPSFSFLSIWLASLIAQERKYTPIEKTRHALLISFIEGMLINKKSTVNIIDGNEYAYWNTKPSDFLTSKAWLTSTLSDLMLTDKGKKAALAVSIAQPLFYDGLLSTSPSFDKGLPKKIQWQWIDENVKYAYASTDNYIWFYSQRINWWQNKVPDTLVSLLNANKNALSLNTFFSARMASSSASSGTLSNINNNKGLLYISDKKVPMNFTDLSFTYRWNKSNKTLKIDFINQPNSVKIYLNNKLYKSYSSPEKSFIATLPGIKKGLITVLADNSKDEESSAIIVVK